MNGNCILNTLFEGNLPILLAILNISPIFALRLDCLSPLSLCRNELNNINNSTAKDDMYNSVKGQVTDTYSASNNANARSDGRTFCGIREGTQSQIEKLLRDYPK